MMPPCDAQGPEVAANFAWRKGAVSATQRGMHESGSGRGTRLQLANDSGFD
jgi:hypothetical protein